MPAPQSALDGAKCESDGRSMLAPGDASGASRACTEVCTQRADDGTVSAHLHRIAKPSWFGYVVSEMGAPGIEPGPLELPMSAAQRDRSVRRAGVQSP